MSLLAEQSFAVFTQHMHASGAMDKAVWAWCIDEVHNELQRYFERLEEEQNDDYDPWDDICDSVPVRLNCYRCGRRGPVDDDYEMCDNCHGVTDEYDDYEQSQDYNDVNSDEDEQAEREAHYSFMGWY